MSFWTELSVFPFVHAVVNVAFYCSFRSLPWAIIAFFVFEYLEKLTTYVSPVLYEDCFDSMVGDPTIGFLAILSFWLLDKVTGFDFVFLRHVSLLRRVLVFSIIGLASPLAPLLETEQIYFGIAIYTAVYVLTIFFGFLPTMLYVGINKEIAYARQAIVIWIIAVIIYALVSLVVVPDDAFFFATPYMRAVSVAFLFILLAAGGLLALPNGVLFRDPVNKTEKL